LTKGAQEARNMRAEGRRCAHSGMKLGTYKT